MKILFINTLYAPHVVGGAEIILKSLVESVAARGHEVCVLTTCLEDGVHRDIIDGINVIRIGIKNIYWSYKPGPKKPYQKIIWHLRDIYNKSMADLVEKIIVEFQPDLINTHNIVGFSAAIWPLISKHKIPLVQVLHDQYAICPNSNMFKNGKRCTTQCASCKLFRLPHKALSNNVDAVIGVSNFVLQHHLKNKLFNNAGIKVSIVNAKKFKAIEYAVPSNVKKNVRFGYIGGLVPAKGVEFLLETFSKISASTSISLVLAGSGNNEYVEKLKKYECDNISFIGYVSPENFFKNIDVLIVPSLWNDTLPTVVFEAFTYGIPVIGSNRGGIPEMIVHGENGFLFDPDSSNDLDNIIHKISSQPEILNLMHEFILKSSKRFINVDSWVDEYIEVFSKLTVKSA